MSVRLGLYVEYLELWETVFPRNQTLIVRLEDYSRDRFATINRVCHHLGLGRCESINIAFHEIHLVDVQCQILAMLNKPFC